MQVFPIRLGPGTTASFEQRFTDNHEGTDIFAPLGAGVLAVADGRVRQATEPKGGKAVYLTEPDGTQWYYAHLDTFADLMDPWETREVEAGELLGYVGTTGNAKNRPPHVHFEWRPQGGVKADPYPQLDQAFGLVDRKKGRPLPQRTDRNTVKIADIDAKGLGIAVLAYLFARGLS